MQQPDVHIKDWIFANTVALTHDMDLHKKILKRCMFFVQNCWKWHFSTSLIIFQEMLFEIPGKSPQISKDLLFFSFLTLWRIGIRWETLFKQILWPEFRISPLSFQKLRSTPKKHENTAVIIKSQNDSVIIILTEYVFNSNIQINVAF